MIECRVKENNFGIPVTDWKPADISLIMMNPMAVFGVFDYRIDGTVYTDWSEEFMEMLAWEKLRAN